MNYIKNINVAIIGCGKIAEKHAVILTSRKLKKFTLVAVCDIDKKKSLEFGRKFNVKSFRSIDLLLSSSKVDLVVICTSSGFHYSNALKVSKYKKNVIIEKPISLNLSDAHKIIKIFEKNKNMLFVVMQYRLNPLIRLLKEAIDKNLLGNITSISIKVWWCREQNYFNQASWRGTWDLDGGLFMNQGIHHLDMIYWLLGPIKSLSALIKRKLVKTETEDIGSVIVEFKNNILGTIEVSTAVRPKNLENSVTVLGDKGNISIGGPNMDNLKLFNLNDKKASNYLIKKYKKKINHNNHYLFYERILKYMTQKKTNSKKFIDGNEAIKSLEIVTAIYRSVIKKKIINLPLKVNYKNNKSQLLSELKEK